MQIKQQQKTKLDISGFKYPGCTGKPSIIEGIKVNF